jgi:hypothetical protein
MLDVNTRIQILDELSHLAGARKHQFAAFCRQEQCLVVWADEVETLIPSAEALEQRMISYVWSGRHRELAEMGIDKDEDQEEGWVDRDAALEEKLQGEIDLGDAEVKIAAEPGSWEARDARPVMLYAPLISGLAMILTFVFIGSGMRECASFNTFPDVGANPRREPDQGSSARRIMGSISAPRNLTLRLPPLHREYISMPSAEASAHRHPSSSVSVSWATCGRCSGPSRTVTRIRRTTLARRRSE